jgi:hypothetical protein
VHHLEGHRAAVSEIECQEDCGHPPSADLSLHGIAGTKRRSQSV